MTTGPDGAGRRLDPYWPPPGAGRALDAVVRPLRSHERLVMAALLVVATLGPIVLWSHSSGPLASASTRLVAFAPDTLVLAPDGSELPAKAGMTLPRGARVRTSGAHGDLATLDTRGRRVTLGESTLLLVEDGSRQDLQVGTVVVDSRHGPGVTVVEDDTVAEVGEDSLARLSWMRATSYEGTTTLRTGVEQTSVTRWYRADRVGASYDSAVAGLALDDLDEQTVPDLVTSELALRDLSAPLLDPHVAATVRARLLPLVGSLPARALDAQVSTAVTALAESETPLADTALCVAISAVGGTPLRTLLDWHDQGGAWVAIAALANADLGAVTARFTELRGALLPTTTPQPGGSSSPSSGQPTGSGGPTSSGSRTRTPTPSTSPTGDLVDSVVTQLPGPAATPVRSSLPGGRPAVTTPPSVPYPRSADWDALLRLLGG